MSAGPIPYPDHATLAARFGGGRTVTLRCALTAKPYDGKVRRSELLLRVGSVDGLLQEIVRDDLVGEQRVNSNVMASIDLPEAYCVVRHQVIAEPIGRLFDHLAGPVAFAYGGIADRAWRRLERAGRVTFFQQGPVRLRAVFDAETRLPLEATTMFGRFRWEYTPTGRVDAVDFPFAGGCLEESRISVHHVADIDAAPARLDISPFYMGFAPVTGSFAPVNQIARQLLGRPHVEIDGVFRSSSMDRPKAFALWSESLESAPVARLAIDDVSPSERMSAIAPGRANLRAVEAGDRTGRLWAADPEYLDFSPGARGRPIRIESEPVAFETTDDWRERCASDVRAITGGDQEEVLA